MQCLSIVEAAINKSHACLATHAVLLVIDVSHCVVAASQLERRSHTPIVVAKPATEVFAEDMIGCAWEKADFMKVAEASFDAGPQVQPLSWLKMLSA